jgi:hypothetical protein
VAAEVTEQVHRGADIELPCLCLLDNGLEVLVAAAGDVQHHHLAQFVVVLFQEAKGVGRLECGDDTLLAGETVEGGERGVVADVDRVHPPLVDQLCELRPDTGVVESRRHGV